MSAPLTRADLVLEILDKLGVIPAGQTPGVEDTTRVNNVLPACVETLSADEISYVPDLEQITPAYFQPLAYVLAYYCSSKFGVTGPGAADIKAKHDENVATLKRITRGKPTFERQRAEYF